jgi:hypothetical protein
VNTRIWKTSINTPSASCATTSTKSSFKFAKKNLNCEDGSEHTCGRIANRTTAMLKCYDVITVKPRYIYPVQSRAAISSEQGSHCQGQVSAHGSAAHDEQRRAHPENRNAPLRRAHIYAQVHGLAYAVALAVRVRPATTSSIPVPGCVRTRGATVAAPATSAHGHGSHGAQGIRERAAQRKDTRCFGAP